MADLPNVNALEIETFKRIAQGNADGPVFMLNLNQYRAEAHYPSGQLYKDYMAVLDQLLLQVGTGPAVSDQGGAFVLEVIAQVMVVDRLAPLRRSMHMALVRREVGWVGGTWRLRGGQ